ncbi:MAG TPA: hypothetical protein VH724_05360 [Candidatus Angelobacter sp.]|nr:hypothetical protein [Candidatus Angelobacter sp.]
MSGPERFFQLEKHDTTFSREIIAGLTTFTTMSYIVVVNPAILCFLSFILMDKICLPLKHAHARYIFVSLECWSNYGAR